MDPDVLPSLLKAEYSKITGVLLKRYGFEHIEVAEDIVGDTFLLATESWVSVGMPKNPVAWLYVVAGNKAKNLLKRKALFNEKVTPVFLDSQEPEDELDFSQSNIQDSQLQMMFAVCHPSIHADSQVGLSLQILCGFTVEEIADAFLTSKDVIYKRLSRAKETLRKEKVKLAPPSYHEIESRLEAVCTTLYLLFNEGYYSQSRNCSISKELCVEAMRLTYMLVSIPCSNQPQVNALLSLMCFHASRFEARMTTTGDLILHDDQDQSLWNKELIARGHQYLTEAAKGNQVSKYHLEAGIACWHSFKEEIPEKWERILQLYNKLLIVEYSPVAALNRTFAYAKTAGKKAALAEAAKLALDRNYLYYALLGYLNTDINKEEAASNWSIALSLAKSDADKCAIAKKLEPFKFPN